MEIRKDALSAADFIELCRFAFQAQPPVGQGVGMSLILERGK